MESKPNDAPLVVILGETASGKTSLSLKIAQQFNGEIIAADSRTLYRGMDIGTAKPTAEEQALVAHHMIDIADPDEPVTAAAYQHLARAAIADVASRGKLPIVVGGTGLYIDALLFNFAFRGPADLARRKELQDLSIEALQQLLLNEGIPLPQNERNPRHLIRQIETNGEAVSRGGLRSNTLVLGLQVDRGVLKMRVVQRVCSMIEQGLEAEARRLSSRYGWELPTMQTIGYQEFAPYFSGKSTIDSVQQDIVRNTLRYAKRQRSWFKRNSAVRYISSVEETADLVTTFLNK